MKTTVEYTKKQTKTGGVICGTKVTLENGKIFNFIARLGKKEAIRNALIQEAK